MTWMEMRAITPMQCGKQRSYHCWASRSVWLRSKWAPDRGNAMGLFGPPNVPILESKHDVKGLIKALRYRKDSRERSDAAWYLREVGDARAIEPLIVALSDSDRRVRSSAARSLGQFGDARAIEPLIAALTDSDWDVRKNAARVAQLSQGARR